MCFFLLAAVAGIQESAVEEHDLDPPSGRISENFLSLARYVAPQTFAWSLRTCDERRAGI